MNHTFRLEDENKNNAGFSDRLVQRIADVREKLHARYERVLPGQSRLIESLLEEAESAAWCTPFPHLFLPDFAEFQLAKFTSAA